MSSFTYCLNTSTIQGQKLALTDEIAIVSRAGYGAIEPWIGQLEAYRDAGGSLSDLRKRLVDAGLQVASGIGFAPWIMDDPTARAAGLERARRDMDLVAQIGGGMIAAPPVGYQDRSGLDLFAAAERYAELMEVGRSIGVLPQLEVWGFSKTLSRLGEAMLIAFESGCADAGLLLDIYHLHKGGSGYDTLTLLAGHAVRIFHVNDYPALPRAELTDAHRLYPGDGTAPVRQVLNTLRKNGSTAFLSVELFNRTYWQQDPLTVARTALEKLKALAPA